MERSPSQVKAAPTWPPSSPLKSWTSMITPSIRVSVAVDPVAPFNPSGHHDVPRLEEIESHIAGCLLLITSPLHVTLQRYIQGEERH
eukprot:CAMPEP_0179016698 /NCGR_PEP_ID=MMETSP0796-20121207/3456_1 /TAXON_ID=73915 /ORGANISM="Pyrodinium bahamense, Strain pbaha01" /LENGTH=86 /DNA_ID=CAMNT_0020712401 /DNA_START=267 /DNA_END=527 /DNA_ORIENTATION=+